MDPAMKVRLGAYLRKQRELCGLSQIDVSRSLHPQAGPLDNSYYYKLESGQLDPKASTLIRLARIFQLEPSELMRFADSDVDTSAVT